MTSPADVGTVLIADDSPEARRLLDIRVRREGYQVLLADNGKQALDLFNRHAVDAVLLDIYMPEMTGFEVLCAIKNDARRSHVPVLMISGGGDQEDLIRCIEMGAVDYLPKPFNQAILRARLSASVRGKRKRDRELASLQSADLAPGPTAEAPTLHSAGQAAAAPAPVAMPPRLGRITLERILGQGSMGQVFLGRHDLLDLPVAVKLLRPELSSNPAMRARILREARVAARISHPNIVRLVEVGETELGLYLAYEYIDGGTLDDLLERAPGRQLEVPAAVRIAREIAAGLAEVHRLGLTHRDIKPSNILLGQDGAVKIADLGLAKEIQGQTSETLTGEHTILGTPLYMAPEQTEGGKDLDIRCDLYSLGIVLYEMLIGRPPFERKSALAVLLSHLVSPVPAPSQARADVPTWLEAVCLKLLAKDRNDRFASPEELLTALRHGPAA